MTRTTLNRSSWLTGSTLRVALSAFVLASCTAWLRPFALPDEGRYAGVAWEMIRSGDWLTPTLNGLIYFHKPPLSYWITASAFSVFGVNEWAARLAPALGFTLATTSVFWLLARWQPAETAKLALPALLAQPLLLVAGQYANLDMLVAGWITLTIVSLAHAALSLETGLCPRTALRAAWMAAAFGVLAKGLIGIVIPAGVMGAWLVIGWRWRTLGQLLLRCPEGPIAFLLIASPWFATMETIHPGFLDYFFVTQHFRRFTVGGFNNQQPVWFYPAVLILLMSPWLFWLGRGLTQSRGLPEPTRSLYRLAWVWALVVIVFFSLPRSKLVGYILPAVPALVLLATLGLTAKASPSTLARRVWYAAVAVGFAASFAAVVIAKQYVTDNSVGIGLALAEQRHDNGPVVMLERFDFDTPLYAKLRDPVWVVEEWDDTTRVRSRDNWRKELGDAAQFSPARARQVLVTASALPDRLCKAPPSWVIASGPADRWAFLGVAEERARYQDLRLWRFDPARSDAAAWCAESVRPLP